MSSQAKSKANFDIGSLHKAEDLKKRLVFVLFALIVFRIGTYIPLPGIDPAALNEFFSKHGGGVLNMFNMFSGGALGRMSIFALAVVPYISASIIMQLFTVVFPALENLKKEGAAGRKQINQYTRYLTVILSLVQGWGISVGLNSMSMAGRSVIVVPAEMFYISSSLILCGGTLFLMWLGEQINSRGIGNGISLLIFSGIVAGLPEAIYMLFSSTYTGALNSAVLIAVVVLVAVLLFVIVFFERAQRRLLIQYPKRQVGNKIFQGEKSHMPIKLNIAGVIPPIFASSILLFPLTIAQFNHGSQSEWASFVSTYLGHGKPLYLVCYVAIIIFFSFFYTAIVFPPAETANNLKKNGGFIAGIRPGKNTEEYLDYLISRLTVIGALYIAFVCALPELLIANYSLPFYLGGTSVLIVANVTIDFVTQVQSHLFAHKYEGLLKKARTGKLKA